MAQPLVAPIAATTADSSVKALSYVALRSHDGKRIILPVAAAAGSRLLHGLFQGLCVMQLHESASEDGPQRSNEASSTAATKAEEKAADMMTDEEQHGVDGAAYRSYAAGFPAHMICQPPLHSSASPSSLSSSAVSSMPQLLEVPMRSLETSTLARVAEFLVVKCTLACHPHYLHEADVFSDLDRTSERDQLTAMQVLLGADFLNC